MQKILTIDSYYKEELAALKGVAGRRGDPAYVAGAIVALEQYAQRIAWARDYYERDPRVQATNTRRFEWLCRSGPLLALEEAIRVSNPAYRRWRATTEAARLRLVGALLSLVESDQDRKWITAVHGPEQNIARWHGELGEPRVV